MRTAEICSDIYHVHTVIILCSLCSKINSFCSPEVCSVKNCCDVVSV